MYLSDPDRVLLRGIQSSMIIIKNSQKTPPTWRCVLQWIIRIYKKNLPYWSCYK